MQDFVHQQYQLHLHFIHSSAWPFLQRTKLRANRSCLRTDREGSVKTVGASKGEDERPVIYYHHHHWQQQQQQQQRQQQLSSPVQSRFQQLWVLYLRYSINFQQQTQKAAPRCTWCGGKRQCTAQRMPDI